MGTSVQVTPLCGVYSENPLSYLVSIDGFDFLVDCGWSLCSRGFNGGTKNVQFMFTGLQWWFGGATKPFQQVSEFDLFTLDDIDAAFQHVNRLTYSQNYHLSAFRATVLESFVRPSVPITDAYNALNNQPSRRQRDHEFLSLADALHSASLNSSSTIEFVESSLEWMNESIAKSFEHTHGTAFLLKYVLLLINKSELKKVPEGPKIVLASMASLEAGFSHDIYLLDEQLILRILSSLQKEASSDASGRSTSKSCENYCLKGYLGRGGISRAYEEEQKREETLKVTLVEEEVKTGSDPSLGDPMVIDSCETHTLSDVINPDDSMIKEENMEQASMQEYVCSLQSAAIR
ncbi:hypothetical protein Cgig2_012491 [Carnegiea gigantea]|uniref:Cleavage and polyadenylation specificity factor subunit 2 n=1 Tax=Carnegiea gigantea TaxID=171969 RepID=A0A9Q1K6F2_9CARY|nr:hypothetical protein Cgig2_012491 [Carnegiea gigantea]